MAVLIVRKAVVEGGGGDFSFNMTAGDLGGVAQGYSDGSLISAFGSIDAEPIGGTTLTFLITGSVGATISFAGNITATVAGLSVWVDGVEFPFDGVDWTFDGEETVASWDTAGPTFVNTVTYFIEIK